MSPDNSGSQHLVTTVAGNTKAGFVDGAGSGAEFGYLAAIATDSQGVLYLSDYGNSAVRKISPGNLVTTLHVFPELLLYDSLPCADWHCGRRRREYLTSVVQDSASG